MPPLWCTIFSISCIFFFLKTWQKCMMSSPGGLALPLLRGILVRAWSLSHLTTLFDIDIDIICLKFNRVDLSFQISCQYIIKMCKINCISLTCSMLLSWFYFSQTCDACWILTFQFWNHTKFSNVALNIYKKLIFSTNFKYFIFLQMNV